MHSTTHLKRTATVPKGSTSRMSTTLPTPAAQYLRMSTERQEYSTENQTQTISKYAEASGFSVIQTYSDPAISGVLLRKRKGLQKLIQDVVQGSAAYEAVLVYDVSRWGRFQDTDESAHYEFLCKSAGVRVHYCAETFTNDDSLPSMIMKSLKRAMAGEYSRELGVKVFAGQRRGASLGFRQGAQPGYGLRRLLVSADKTPKQLLMSGERKSIASDRVILVRGPDSEIRCIRGIYRMFVQRRMTFSEIARELNFRRTKYIDGSEWSLRAVQTILTHPKYVGCNIYGRNTQRLYTPLRPKPRSEWTITPGAFESVVEPELYAKAQRIIQQTNECCPRNRSDEDLLNALRVILATNGRITLDLIKNTPKTPSAQTYNTRFGTLTNAYQLIGYAGFWQIGWIETRRRIQALRDDLIRQIVQLNPRISIENRGAGYRTRLQMPNGRLISVLVSRPILGYKNVNRWLLIPRKAERGLITLVARLSLACDAFKDLFLVPPLVPPLGPATVVYTRDHDQRLQNGVRLTILEDFFGTIEIVTKQISALSPLQRSS